MTPRRRSKSSNSARYYLCFLVWDAGQYYDAAVLGEFLATRYPDSTAGRQGARIALAAYGRLYSEAKGPDKSFEIEQVRRVAELTLKRWPKEEEADEAALTLVNLAIADHQFDQATKYLERLRRSRRAARKPSCGSGRRSGRPICVPPKQRPMIGRRQQSSIA